MERWQREVSAAELARTSELTLEEARRYVLWAEALRRPVQPFSSALATLAKSGRNPQEVAAELREVGRAGFSSADVAERIRRAFQR